MNKRVANVLHHKLKHLKHSALHLKAAIGSINNGKDVDILALKWINESFDFNALKNTKETKDTKIQRLVDIYREASFKTDIIDAKTTAVRKALEGYIKSIRRYDNEGNLYFEYTEEDNVLKIKMKNPN
jgi:plasmid rolling circle replication initiator protein Rep